MHLTYRNLFTDPNAIEFSVVKSGNTHCLCLQGNASASLRIKKAFAGARFFFPLAQDNFYEPISFNDGASDAVPTALFKYTEAGFLADFLRSVPKEWQYAAGRKLGRVLKQLHSSLLSDKQRLKATARHDSFMEKVAEYITDLPHFKNDKYALEALSMRYDNFKIYRPVMRYGSFKHSHVMITHDTDIMLLPSYAYGEGDACEDFALLEFESAGLYPLLCAGVVDGYFSGVVPPAFWTHFALYSALYSVWKCGQRASKNKAEAVKMQITSDRMREDFSNFTKPIPLWYTSNELQSVRQKASKL